MAARGESADVGVLEDGVSEVAASPIEARGAGAAGAGSEDREAAVSLPVGARRSIVCDVDGEAPSTRLVGTTASASPVEGEPAGRGGGGAPSAKRSRTCWFSEPAGVSDDVGADPRDDGASTERTAGEVSGEAAGAGRTAAAGAVAMPSRDAMNCSARALRSAVLLRCGSSDSSAPMGCGAGTAAEAGAGARIVASVGAGADAGSASGADIVAAGGGGSPPVDQMISDVGAPCPSPITEARGAG